MLSWNQNKLSFDLNFINSSAQIFGSKIDIPILTVDINHSSLLLGKFKIDSLSFNNIDYVLDQDFIPEQKSRIIANPKEILDGFFKKIPLFGSIKINNFNLKTKMGKELVKLKEFDYQIKYGIFNDSFTIAFKIDGDNKELDFNAKCNFKINNQLKNCNIRTRNFDSHILRNLKIFPENAYANLDAILELDKKLDYYDLSGDIYLRDIRFAISNELYFYDQVKLKTLAKIGENHVKLDKLEINTYDKKVNLDAKYSYKSKKLSIDANGQNIDRQEIFLLWQNSQKTLLEHG